MTAPFVQPAAARAHPAAAPPRRLLAAGVAAGPVFLAVALVQAFTRDGFDLERHAVSQLALGPGGYVQIANFVLTGALLVLASRGLRRALAPGVGAVWGARLVAGFGVGMLVAGVFVADPAYGFPAGTADGPGQISWHGAVHALGFAVAMVSWVSGCVVLARALAARDDRLAAGACVLALIGAVVVGASPAAGAFTVRLVLVSAVQLGLVAFLCARLAHPVAASA
jgi:hypothetical protein